MRAELTVADARDAADLLARLADPDRRPDAALVAAAHAALAAAVVDGRVDPADVDPPERIRALDGSVADAADAVVLDAPELAAVLSAAEVVVGGDPRALADLLDLPTASEFVDGEVAGTGRAVPWAALPEVVVTCHTLGVPVPEGELWCHDELWVVLHHPAPGRHRVPTWRDADGRRQPTTPSAPCSRSSAPAESGGETPATRSSVVPRVVLPRVPRPRDDAGRIRRVCRSRCTPPRSSSPAPATRAG